MTRALRVLVVEDEMMVAMLVQDMLEDLGHVAVGPAVQLGEGLELASSETLDLAILDINLNGLMSFPIADLLTERGIPVIFATGYGAGGLEGRFVDFPVMSKPFSMASLRRAMSAADPCGDRPGTTGAHV